MKKRPATFLLSCLILAMALLPVAAHADTGPKPSVRITFENMGQEPCYGTLLSKSASTGPSRAWDGDAAHAARHEGEEDYEIWEAFAQYEDPDGFYFLQEWWACSENHALNWTYYPPETFKILLYYPDSGRFAVSGIYERYAFDSYYTVDLGQAEAQQVTLTAERSYDYTWELISLLCRVVITILLELAIALAFGFREKKLFSLIVWINIATQVILNVALNVIGYRHGSYAFVAYYILFEIAVFVIEAILYALLFNRVGRTRISKAKSTAYALIAHVCSFAAGFLIARVIPGIF